MIHRDEVHFLHALSEVHFLHPKSIHYNIYGNNHNLFYLLSLSIQLLQQLSRTGTVHILT